MRLGQLARRLELRPAQIVEFLAQRGIQVEEGVNTRLENDHVNTVLTHFDPGNEKRGSGEPEIKEPEILEEEKVQAHTVPVTAELKEDKDAEAEVPTGRKTVEVIKAPKVELSGLKVLGKIELPEVKKKEEKTESIAEVSQMDAPEIKQQQRVRNTDRKVQRAEQRTRKNPIALQREREALEAQKKREEQAEREKERRTRNYQKRVKMSPPTKAVRLVEEPVMQMTAEELEEAPRTWLGRFVKWLTTA